MDWHIITGSKGGVGKTLLSLLLLAYHLEEKTNEGILILDLNAMNADTASMLCYQNEVNNPKEMQIEQIDRTIMFKKINSKLRDFLVGWPVNPFLLYNYHDFVALLQGIKQHLNSDFTKDINFSLPIKHVIIDTNYHFCSLFPEQDEHYDKHYKGFSDDCFNIWFLWVYRQLESLLGNKIAAATITRTIGAIERKLTCLNEKNMMGPLIHTYTPVGLLPTEAIKGNFLGFGGEKLPERDEDFIIKDLDKLEELTASTNIYKFKEWIDELNNAKKRVLQKQANHAMGDTHRLFSKILREALEKDERLPRNIFPLSIYEAALEGYTDRERPDIIESLRALNTYTRFKKLVNRKYGNES